MMNLAARNALYCLVPAVILVSWYFYLKRKKKRDDSIITQITSLQLEPNHGLDSSSNICSSIENTSDFSNTLSDASSISSPENSLKTESVCDTLNEDIKYHASSKVSHVIKRNHVDHLCFSNLTFLKNDKSVPNCNAQVHKVESIVGPFIKEGLESSSYDNVSEVNKSSLQLNVSEKNSNSLLVTEVGVEDLTPENEHVIITATCHSEFSNGFHSNAVTNLLVGKTNEQISHTGNTSFDDVIEEPIISKLECNLLNNVLSDQNINHMPNPFKQSEGDSHSSVLDENSLSSMSDESDQQTDFKCKDSPSSVFDGNSISDESVKMNANNSKPAINEETENCLGNDEQLSTVISDEKYSIQLNKNSFFAKTLFVKDLTQDGSEVAENVANDSTSNLQNCDSLTQDSSSSTKPYLDDTADSNIIVKHNYQQTMLQDIFSCKNIQKLSPTASIDETISSTSEVISSTLLQTSCNQTNRQSETAANLLSCDTIVSSSTDEAPLSQKEPSKLYVPDQLDSIFPVQNNSSETINIKDQDNPLESSLSQSKVSDLDMAEIKSSVMSPALFVYEFDLPQELCGRLIGKQGKHVKSIKERTNANVFIKRHPFDNNLKTVVVEGSRIAVNDALDIIRRKFPPSQFPTVSLLQTNMMNTHGVSLPESLQLHLPEGASCDVILSSLTDAGHFYLQQPTHPTYPSLSTLDQIMINCYSQMDTPPLPHPVEAGVICAAPVMNGWYRAQVIYVQENRSECEVKFVDYGGVSTVLTSSLRQIRSDFMTLPFQASECYLANVRPVGDRWSEEATSVFEELAQGQILQALLIEYAEDGIPCVQLYRVQGVSNMFINRELVERGLGVWVNNSRWDPH